MYDVHVLYVALVHVIAVCLERALRHAGVCARSVLREPVLLELQSKRNSHRLRNQHLTSAVRRERVVQLPFQFLYTWLSAWRLAPNFPLRHAFRVCNKLNTVHRVTGTLRVQYRVQYSCCTVVGLMPYSVLLHHNTNKYE